MSEKEQVLVAFANENEMYVQVNVLEKWQPKNVNYFNDVVYFKNEDVYVSMKRTDFEKIFKKDTV